MRTRVPEETFPRVFGRISFFVNAGIRFVEEHAKLRAMGQMWEAIGRERYGVEDDGFLLVDWKTNRTATADPLQLALYRLAWSELHDVPLDRVRAAFYYVRTGEVVVDDATYTAKVGKRSLDLTFKEFELLKFLAQHPGRVFSRQQLLQEVWGYDYFGGTRTVDVHVRRLRAKLGPENETLIGTVRNVGYRFVLPTKERDTSEARRGADA